MARLYDLRGTRPNFGDELNPWLWPRLPPGFLDDASDELFLGSGYGYGDPPKLQPGKWRIHCVRGPHTAQALGLPDTLAVGDPASLLHRMPWPRPTKQYPVSYMPHWESIDRGHWPLACTQADVHFIDPTAPVESVVAEWLTSELLIAEAMHSAVVASASRPWRFVQPQLRMHRSSAYAESASAHYRRLRQWLGRGLQSFAGVLRRPVAVHGRQIANDASPTDLRARSLPAGNVRGMTCQRCPACHARLPRPPYGRPVH
jgi:hypothetical protein